MALALSYLALVEKFLPNWAEALRDEHKNAFDGVLFGVPILVVIIQLTREAIDRIRARRMRERVIQNEVTEPGAFLLTPYGADSRAQFPRPDNALEDVISLIKNSTEPLLYLTGSSGAGKSSLLAAAVIPSLEDKQWCVVSARTYSDPEATLEFNRVRFI